MSIIFGTVIVPALAARETDARRGLALTVRNMVTLCVCYMLAYRFVWPRMH